MTERQTPPQDIIRGVRPAQRAVNATLQSDGVRLVLDAVSEDEETDLLALVDEGRWDCSLSRRVQHYGHRFASSEASAQGFYELFLVAYKVSREPTEQQEDLLDRLLQYK